VVSEDSTIQRPLVMDFRKDPAVREIGDQFLFGPSILVSPVLREHATSRSLYLPAGADWFDFWTGKKMAGGVEIVADAPLDRIPLHVRAGAIIPLGPEIEYAGQATDPIELRVYPGADGDFTLYEDEGDSYRYEQGAHATVAIHWDEEWQLQGYASGTHVQRDHCGRGARHRRRRNGLSGQDGALHRRNDRGEVLKAGNRE
jgi:alpha-D-xyloside xylohydrolase